MIAAGTEFGEVIGQIVLDLVDRAGKLGYPMDILRMSLRSYRWSRRFVDGVVVSRPVVAGQGIGPGSAFVVYELAALMKKGKSAGGQQGNERLEVQL